MSIDIQDRVTAPPPGGGDDFTLKGGRGGGRKRGWLIGGAAAMVAAIVVVIVLVSGGSNAKTVTGSHFGTNLKVAYEADSAPERTFLQWLDTSIAPKYGCLLRVLGQVQEPGGAAQRRSDCSAQ